MLTQIYGIIRQQIGIYENWDGFFEEIAFGFRAISVLIRLAACSLDYLLFGFAMLLESK